MSESGARWPGDALTCRSCGARNPPGALVCGSCGASLVEHPEEGMLIDVTSGEPEIVAVDGTPSRGSRSGGMTTVTFDRGRVVVARGGRRACLITLVLLLLVTGCTCWLLWTALGSVF